MENSRLLKLLRTFSPDELKSLKKFVQTPFFNQRPEVAALLGALEKSIRTQKPAPEKEAVYPLIFDKSPFDDHRLRMAMSFLYKEACRFLTVRDFLDNTRQQQKRLATIFRQRGLTDQFEQALEAATALHLEDPLRNADHYQENYELLLEKHRFDIDRQSVGGLNLQELSDQSDYAFLARKLWQSCFMLSHQAVSNTTYRFGLLDVVLEQVEQSDAINIPAIAVYYFCYRALTHPDDPTQFQQFKTRVLQFGHLFPAGELRDLYILAINFCIRQYNAGNSEYLREQFDFYKEGLDKKYFLTDGSLSRYTYLNAATSGLVMHELEWVNQFIHSYREHLPEAYRDSLFSFNLARLEYQRRNLGIALQLLQKADYREILLNLAAKTLQMKIFYELGETDLLESHLQAIKTFIHRKKVMGYHRENYLNTVYFTQKLLETAAFDKKTRLSLRTQIESTKAVAEKEWLLGICADG
jgi:hypothetical protein